MRTARSCLIGSSGGQTGGGSQRPGCEGNAEDDSPAPDGQRGHGVEPPPAVGRGQGSAGASATPASTAPIPESKPSARRAWLGTRRATARFRRAKTLKTPTDTAVNATPECET